MGVLGDILGGVSSVGSFIGQALSNRAQAKENQKNRDFALEMWNKENEYNLPQNQMARLQVAGLNPNLVYGQGTSTLSAHAQTPSTDNNYANVAGQGLKDYFAAHQVTLQEKATQSNILLNEQLGKKADEEAKLATENAEKVQWENIITSHTYENTIQQSIEQLEILHKENLIKDEDYKIRMEQYNEQLEKVRKARAEADIEEEKVNTQIAQTDYLISETELNNERVITEKSTQFKNNSEAAYYKAQRYATIEGVKLTQAQAGYYNALKNKTQQETSNLKEYKKQIVAQTTEILSQAGLNKKQANKVAVEAFNLVANGKVDRAVKLFDMELKNTSQRYGTGTIGSTIGVCLDLYNNYRKWRHSPLDTHNNGATTEW